ncbi:MAG: hypothetical protein R3Y09_12355 [Clostridia bacterium]
MATKSITKQYKVNDVEMYKKIEKEFQSRPLRYAVKKENSNIDRGRQKLKEFSFR